MAKKFKCNIPAPRESFTDVKRVEWTEGQETRLASLAANRATAFGQLSAMYESADPVTKKLQDITKQAQQYWETISFDAGNLGFLSPQKSANAQSWLATWMGAKQGLVKDIRNPLLNVKRQADGMMREAGVYGMMAKQAELAKALKQVAKEVGDEARPEDMRRLLEEGMTPQRLAVYGNTEQMTNALEARYVGMVDEFMQRGYSRDQVDYLLSIAGEVSNQSDNYAAVLAATGMDVNMMFNIGMMPRQFTEEGFALAKLAGGVNVSTPEFVGAALNKSRNTWNYLPEDHALAASFLGVGEDQLHSLIANPGDFAQFLSKRTSDKQLLDLVDSGVMSKIPMVTSEVNEYLTRKWGMPGGDAMTDLFIQDPLEATKVLSKKLSSAAQQSSMLKLINTEGIEKGWVVTPYMFANDVEFKDYVKLSEVKGVNLAAGDGYVHPLVANQLQGLIEMTSDPALMSKGARVWSNYTSMFAKQALGNPFTAPAYLSGQFLGNMFATMGAGVSITRYAASVEDMTKLAFKGLDVFDDVTPVYLIDGVELTERALIAKTMRMFSHEVLPGIDGKDALFKLEYFNPMRIAEQLGKMKAASRSNPAILAEMAGMFGRGADSVFSPAIRMAAIMDTASHIAVVKQFAPRVKNGGAQNFFNAMGGKKHLTTWADLTQEVTRTVPVFDDMGKVQKQIALVIPFSGWAMQNAPIQLADMMRNPSKWHNYARIQALWNDMVVGDDEVLNGEMPSEEAAKYGLVIRRDGTSKGTVILQTDQYDPKWGALTWLLENAKVLDSENKLGDVKKSLDGVDSNPVIRAIQKTLARSYYAPAAKILTGLDLYTGKQVDGSEYQGTNKFAGVPMPPWMQAVLSVSPVLQSLDRLPIISGTKAVVDPRNGAILRAATQDWLGGRGEVEPSRLEGVEGLLQVLGGRVRYIDGIKNMQWTEVRTKRGVQELTTKILKEQTAMAVDLKSGGLQRDTPSYRARLSNIETMANAAIQLNFDLQRIRVWGIRNRVPEMKAVEEFQKRGIVLDNEPLPGAEYIKKALDDAAKLKKGTP